MSDRDIKNFPAAVYSRRIEKIQRRCQDAGINGLIIGTGAELAYLLGMWVSTHERLCALVIPASGQPTFLIPAVDRGEVEHSVLSELDISVTVWLDGENPHHIAINALGDDPQRVAIGSSLTADHLLRIQHLLPSDVRFELAAHVLKEQFMAKDEAEIAQLRAAGSAIDRVHSRVPGLLIPGQTEREVATELKILILKEHVEVDFVIVGSGSNGANPHHSYSDRVLNEGESVVIDIGGTYGSGYHSDCTRTYIVGGDQSEIDPEFAKLYNVLYRAQLAACVQARPGVTAQSVDAAAREIIEDAGYGEYFTHRTGHGIGLSTHEEPFIMANNQLILVPGMAFSIEPGIYIPGQFGARIEDIVTITHTGCELLNNQPKELR